MATSIPSCHAPLTLKASSTSILLVSFASNLPTRNQPWYTDKSVLRAEAVSPLKERKWPSSRLFSPSAISSFDLNLLHGVIN
jgi:hypothetical protein